MSQYFPNIQSGIPIDQDYYRVLLDDREIASYVLYRNYGNAHLNYLIDNIVGSGFINKNKFIVENYFTNDPTVNLTVLGTTTYSSGNTIATITLTDASSDVMVNSAILVDSTTNTNMRVIDHSNGQVVVKFISGASSTQTSFNTSSDLLAGAILVQSSTSQPFRGSLPTESQKIMPENFKSYIQHFRKSVSLDKTEMTEKSRLPIANINGVQYLAYQQVENTKNEFLQSITRALMLNNEMGGDDNIDKDFQTASLPYQIRVKGDGGVTYTDTANQTLLNRIIDQMRERNNGAVEEILVLDGQNFWGQIQQNLAPNLLQYTGMDNTVGGKVVKGIDFDTYSYNGCTIKRMRGFQEYSSPKLFPAMSQQVAGRIGQNSAMFLNTRAVNTIEGTQPFIQKYVYGDNSTGAMYRYNVIEGAIDAMGNYKKESPSGEYSVTHDFATEFAAVLQDPTLHVEVKPAS